MTSCLSILGLDVMHLRVNKVLDSFRNGTAAHHDNVPERLNVFLAPIGQQGAFKVAAKAYDVGL
jgi:hypothetical protein